MSKMYEEICVVDDPFCIACGDCSMEEIEYWVPVTEESLRESHSLDLMEDKGMPEAMRKDLIEDGMWSPVPESFEEWLEQCIANGYVREVC